MQHPAPKGQGALLVFREKVMYYTLMTTVWEVLSMGDAIIQGMHGCSREDEYVAPNDPLIQERLSWFQDQKLALMMHFGIYTLPGICESWPLSEEDAVWSREEIDWEKDPSTFRRQYVDLNKSFNPIRVRPEVWAETLLHGMASSI